VYCLFLSLQHLALAFVSSIWIHLASLLIFLNIGKNWLDL